MSEIHEVSRLIGGLEKSVEALTTTWAEQDRRAAEGGRALYEKVDDLSNKLTALTGRVEQLARSYEKIEPKVQKSEENRHRSAGARAMLVFVWSTVVAGLGAMAYAVHTIVTTFWPPPRP